MSKFFEELKRRNVIKSALAYLVVAWVLLQVFSLLLPMVDAPDWVLKGITLLMAIGLPIWIIVSWVYDITPQGIEKTTKDTGSELVTQATNKRLNVFIIASLSIVVIVLTLKITNVFESSDKQFTIAVLPFIDISQGKDNEWFGDAITTDIYTYLSKVKGLKVISTKSTIKYKDTKKTIPEIADELGADFLVEGNVRKQKNQVLISSSLIEANDEQLWAENYNESEEDPFKIQQAVAKQIVEELKIILSPKEENRLEKYPTENKEAYDLFSKGRFVMANDSREKEDLEKNIELNKQAAALDPNFAEAYAEIAQSTFLLAYNGHGVLSFEEGMDKAMFYVEKALELNPDTPRALAAKGIITSNRGNWPEAQDYFEKAVAVSPSDATIHYQYALHLRYKDTNKHRKHVAISQELDPRSAQIGHQYFASLINNYKIKEAKQYFNKYKSLFTYEGEKIEKESILIAYTNKDWTAALQFLESEIKKDSNNIALNRMLGQAYAGILIDYNKAIKYTKKAYELDSTNLTSISIYLEKLILAKKFKGAEKLMQTKNFKSVFRKPQELNFQFWYYYEQGNYTKAQEFLMDSLMPGKYFKKLSIDASLGNKRAIDSFFKTNPKMMPEDNAIIFALLKKKDSMYYYLEKTNNINTNRIYNVSEIYDFGLVKNNMFHEFDPYRKEERYKAFLKKHYLPLTQWNE